MAEDLSMFGVSNAPAAAVATSAPSTGDDLSMFGISPAAAPKQESNFLQHPVDSTVNYVSGWGGAIHDAVSVLNLAEVSQLGCLLKALEGDVGDPDEIELALPLQVLERADLLGRRLARRAARVQHPEVDEVHALDA